MDGVSKVKSICMRKTSLQSCLGKRHVYRWKKTQKQGRQRNIRNCIIMLGGVFYALVFIAITCLPSRMGLRGEFWNCPLGMGRYVEIVSRSRVVSAISLHDIS